VVKSHISPFLAIPNNFQAFLESIFQKNFKLLQKCLDQYATPFDGNQWCAVIVADGGSNTFDGCIQDQTCQKNPTFPRAIKAPKKDYQFENSGAIRPIAKNPKFHH
jgi:hypothetical protein